MIFGSAEIVVYESLKLMKVTCADGRNDVSGNARGGSGAIECRIVQI